ncbi:AI-2E family transporter [Nocardiopsis composta]|uniref:Putative PurR-regulated permease PerM n=1 Tax=Nocardiopsis composta TaxID=157465 RepID=A0A7W8VD91_9ACTN|nr:AI-2E family transporter [Nocardiopsis composta]MBB5431694.1 putative PurR-regulated permease PerM [Nocardiopsis composta]
MRWPGDWAFFRRRRAAIGGADGGRTEPAQAEPPKPEPPEEDDLLRRVSEAAWRLLIIGVVVALLLWGLAYLSVISVPVILAVFLTALLMPPTNWLRRKGLGRGLSTTLTCVGALILLGGVVTLIVQPAISGFSGLVDSVDKALDSVTDIATRLGLQPELVNQIVGAADQELTDLLADNRDQLMTGVWTAGTAVLEVLLGLVLILVLTVYFVHSGDKLVEWLRGLFPAASRRPLQAAGELAYGVMGRYVRGVATVGFIDAVGIGIPLFFLIDPALAIPLIVLTFIGAFLPIVGAFVSGLLAAVVAFVTEGPLAMLLVIAAVLIVQQLESHVFAPRVYGRALDLPAAVVLVAISAGGIIGGIAGMFLATPVAAVLAALLRDRPFSREEPVVEESEVTAEAGEASAASGRSKGGGNGTAAAERPAAETGPEKRAAEKSGVE